MIVYAITCFNPSAVYSGLIIGIIHCGMAGNYREFVGDNLGYLPDLCFAGGERLSHTDIVLDFIALPIILYKFWSAT